MDKNNCYKAGFIMRPHGLSGAVTVSFDVDSPADWESLQSIMIEINGRLVPYLIESVSLRKDKAFVKLEEVDTPEAAATLKSCAMYLPKESRPQTEEDDFYNDEVIGFEVVDEEAGVLGAVEDIEQAGPNRFLIVQFHGKEIMIPTQQPLLKSINKSKRKINVNLPEGFLDI
jgi:16S rRNA processing protein RimM